MNQKTAIQGIQGSFHHQVAQEYFGQDVSVTECMSFQELMNSLNSGTSQTAVMAIENSIAGSILPNYALIDEYGTHITGEYYIPIIMNLMALPGQKIGDIKEVYSHPMALLQCKDFFRNYPEIKLIEDADTAEVAKRISENKLKKVGAVASNAAADIFKLEILAADIHSIKSNATRFLILSNTQLKPNGVKLDKASLKFEINDRHGSLVTVLNVIKDCNLNMTKIQSLPIIDKPWEYAFFVDVTFSDFSDFDKAIKILTVMTDSIKILGTYKSFGK
ncbi:MAG TPA: prephenate dehydratase [Salinimicrobium sp.]|nr:prephenate dehydratase [Salinimicrobium sp.]